MERGEVHPQRNGQASRAAKGKGRTARDAQGLVGGSVERGGLAHDATGEANGIVVRQSVRVPGHVETGTGGFVERPVGHESIQERGTAADRTPITAIAQRRPALCEAAKARRLAAAFALRQKPMVSVTHALFSSARMQAAQPFAFPATAAATPHEAAAPRCFPRAEATDGARGG